MYMKKFALAVAFPLLVIGSKTAFAQLPQNGCGSTQLVSCGGGCDTIYEAPSDGSFVSVSYGYENCCGIMVVVAYEGGSCNMGLLRGLQSDRTRMALVADGVQLMVRDCDGHFSIYYSEPLKPDHFKWEDFGRISVANAKG
jgi:hypothetical protein